MKLRLLLLAGLQLGAASAAAQRSGKPRPHEREWDFIARQIDQWTFTEDLTVIVGNATDILWTHTKGRLTPHTVVETESTSKWPMAMMLAGVAADGSFGRVQPLAKCAILILLCLVHASQGSYRRRDYSTGLSFAAARAA